MASRTVALVVACALIVVGCGGSDGELAASCTVERSEFGPFGPETALGATMDEATARARTADAGFDYWLVIHADGNWDVAWQEATEQFGGALHDDLSWIDVGGTLDGLYGEGERHGFADLRVSRSFQGKLEDANEPLFVGVGPDATEVNLDAACTVSSVIVGDQETPARVDLLGGKEMSA